MTSETKPVAVLHPITRLIVGGAQENTMYTAAFVDKTRFQVAVISGPQTGSEGSLIQTVRELGIKLEILPELVREINPWSDLVALWKLYKRMRDGNYFIVHTHSSKAGILGRVAARLARIPIIIHTVHGWSFHERMNFRRRRFYIELEKFTASFSDALIVVAERDIMKGVTHGIGKLNQYHLIRSAISLSEFSPVSVDRIDVRQELGIPVEVPVLGNVGRLSPQKNPLDWVRTAAMVADMVPECHYLLVGDGPLRHDVESLLFELGIADRTIITGIRRDVCKMLAAMDVFLLTSLWEGLPRVIPQAMAMEIPVVANRVDGIVEAVENGVTGYLCHPGELDQMAKFCADLLNNPSLCRELGLNGHSRAIAEFDLKKMIAQIENLYANLLNQKGY